MLLVILFRKTKSRQKRSKKLENTLKSAHSNVKNQKIKTPQEINGRKVFLFPWYFKIILYFVSFLSMAISILFVLFKGNRFIKKTMKF
jgi:hypothetical protein